MQKENQGSSLANLWTGNSSYWIRRSRGIFKPRLIKQHHDAYVPGFGYLADYLGDRWTDVYNIPSEDADSWNRARLREYLTYVYRKIGNRNNE